MLKSSFFILTGCMIGALIGQAIRWFALELPFNWLFFVLNIIGGFLIVKLGQFIYERW